MGHHDHVFDDARVLDLIPLIYDAAMDASRWQTFLEALGGLYPDSGRALWYETRAGADVGVVCTAGFEPGVIESYAAHYGRLSPWTDVMQNKPSGHVHTGEMMVPERELVRTEFYNDWLRPQKLGSGFGSTVLNEGDRQMYFSILPPRERPSGEADLQFLRRLVPHLQRAAAMHARFARLESHAGSLEALLEHLDLGAMLIGEDRRIALANRAGEALLSEPDGLFVRCGKLGAWDPRDDSALRRAIDQALATAKCQANDGGTQLVIARPSGKRPLSVLVAPIFPVDAGGTSPMAHQRPSAGVFVTNPESDRSAAIASVANAHGLTDAETSLLTALVTEGSLPRAAKRLSIAHETARSHLKAIFAKSGAGSQAEVVRLVLTSVPAEGRT